MANKDFTISFIVNKTPHEVFTSINNPRGWWGEGIKGATEKLNDEFVYRHKELHFTRHKLTEVIPDKKIVWLTTESQLNFIEKKDEWTGSKVVFEISDKDGKTEVRFTHQGLRPDVECYNDCSNGWTYYIGSLKELIEKGVGKPDPKEFATAGIA